RTNRSATERLPRRALSARRSIGFQSAREYVRALRTAGRGRRADAGRIVRIGTGGGASGSRERDSDGHAGRAELPEALAAQPAIAAFCVQPGFRGGYGNRNPD